MQVERIKKWLPIGIVALAFLVALLLVIFSSRSRSLPLTQKKWPVHAVRVRVGHYHPQIILYAMVESPRVAKITAAITADVSKTPVREGQLVKKGQLLIQLDDRRSQLIVNQREAEIDDIEAQLQQEAIRYGVSKKALSHEKKMLDLAHKELQRQRKLVGRNYVSRSQLDKTEQEYSKQLLAHTVRGQSVVMYQHQVAALTAKLERAQSLLAQAQLDLQYTQIKAPFAGAVVQLSVADGDRVRPGEALLQLVDTTHLEVRATVPGQYISYLYQALLKKQTVLANTQLHGKPVRLQLRRLSRRVRSGQVGQEALFSVLSAAEVLPLGKVVTVSLQLPAIENSVKLPITALYGKDKIYRIQQQRLHALTVKYLGDILQQDKIQQVIVQSSQLHDGDWILTTPLPNAIDGLLVSILPTEATHGK